MLAIIRTLPLVLLLLCSGCIKRTERIVIHADGSALLETTFKGDPSDVHGGDAAPTTASGWEVADQVEVDKEGKEQLTRTAKRQLAAGQAWPACYAPAGSALELSALQFPTTLTIEQTAGGTYYHFKRVYTGRPFSYVHYFKQRAEDSDEYQAITKKKAEELTAEEYQSLVKLLIEVDRRQAASFIERAAGQFTEVLPQLAVLNMQKAALAVYEQQNLAARAVELLQADDGKGFDDLEEQVRHLQVEAVRQALASSGIQSLVASRFIESYELLRTSFRITEDLGDEEWAVAVKMPGRLVAHNSSDPHLGQHFKDKRPQGGPITEDVMITYRTDEGQTGAHYSGPIDVAWDFKGDALRDRDVVLMATSFVPDSDEPDAD